ncbi:uncharacterized protein LOC129903626 [Solanum dulcamara]|uniref:uncharacterized protein LOC129903626 n=1 Tax=Solanum dulcamara TaxID=45834 RepID=UPI0024853FEF|nr:uncharacterized protein LOC129903626 [Solanum dulcamara]
MAMLVNEMDISLLMTYAEQIENEKLRERSRGFKKARFDGGRFNKDKGTNPMVQIENVGAQTFPICKKYGRTHKGECLAVSNACFKCGNPGHHIRDCRGSNGLRPQDQIAQGQQAQRGGQRTNCFYSLHGRQGVKQAPNIVTGCPIGPAPQTRFMGRYAHHGP